MHQEQLATLQQLEATLRQRTHILERAIQVYPETALMELQTRPDLPSKSTHSFINSQDAN